MKFSKPNIIEKQIAEFKYSQNFVCPKNDSRTWDKEDRQ